MERSSPPLTPVYRGQAKSQGLSFLSSAQVIEGWLSVEASGLALNQCIKEHAFKISIFVLLICKDQREPHTDSRARLP